MIVMKKLFALLLGLALVCALAFAVAEEPWEDVEIPEEARVFEAAWTCGGSLVEVFAEDGGFRVSVTVPGAYPEGTVWEYSCDYNAENKTLVSMPTGIKAPCTLSADGTYDLGASVYEDGQATFSLNEQGQLVWNDEKEQAGEGMAFDCLGGYLGSWVSLRPDIEITWDYERACCAVAIHWADSAFESWDWALTGRYNPETGALEATGTRTVTTFDETTGEETGVESTEASAVLTLTDASHLTWDGAEDLVFEYDLMGV